MKKVVLAGVLVACLLSGCVGRTLTNDLTQVQIASRPQEEPMDTREKRADQIKAELLTLAGVESAAVVVDGHTALIGLRVQAGKLRDEGYYREEATILAKKADPTITNAAVTVNNRITDLIERIERDRQKLTNE